MAQLFANNAISRLASAVSPISMTIYVDPARANLFPDPQNIDDYFLITLDDIDDVDNFEIVKISHRLGNQLFVAERGFEGTVPKTWTIESTLVDHRITAGTLQSFLPAVRRPHTNIPAGTTIVIDAFQPSSENLSQKWQVTLQSPDLDKYQFFEINAIYLQTANDVKFTVFGVVGNSFNVDVDIVLQGGYIKLIIQNDEPASIVANVIRIQHV